MKNFSLKILIGTFLVALCLNILSLSPQVGQSIPHKAYAQDDAQPTRTAEEAELEAIESQLAEETTEEMVLIPVVESLHPYPHNHNENWLISNLEVDAEATRLHFARLELEENVDYLIVTDAEGIEFQRITGFYPDGSWTEPVPGNLVQLRLVSDKSVQEWGFAVDGLKSEPYTTLAYSAHPYPNNAALEWRFDNLDAAATATRLHFSRLHFEENVDWLVIMDLTETPYQWITGDHSDGLWTIGVPGNGVVIKLISDGSVTDWGFNVDAMESASPDEVQPRSEPNESLAESEHPYQRNVTQDWTVVNSNPAAAFTKVHLSQLDLSGGDWFGILDGSDNLVQAFGEHTHLEDFWSDDVPGRVVKLRLFSNNRSDTDWGFHVNQTADGIAAPALAETPHNYPRNWSNSWNIINPNPAAAFTKIYFSRLDLSGGEWLGIYDGNENLVQGLGEHTHIRNSWSDDIPGRVVGVQLWSNDRSDIDWGFRIDRVADGEAKPSLAESPHNYARNWSNTWTVVNPNPTADFSRLYFTRLDLSGGDSLILYDGTDTEVQVFPQNTHSQDFWSNDIPGRVVNVRLVSNDRNDTDWGFRVSDIEPKAARSPLPAFVNAIYVHISQPGTIWLNDKPIGRALTPGDYRIWLPQLGENLITVESLFHEQEIRVDTDPDGGVRIEYDGIQTKDGAE